MTERLLGVYRSMISRCENPNATYFRDYGGRGIAVDPEWRKSYDGFRSWALEAGYQQGLTIDRIDNDGDYSPSNCRWVTRAVQARNKRSNVPIAAWGETKLTVEWLDDPRCVVARLTLRRRLSLGWDPGTALSAPVGSVHRSWSETGRARSAECAKGHPFTIENTITDSRGFRQCRICTAARQRRWKEGRKR